MSTSYPAPVASGVTMCIKWNKATGTVKSAPRSPLVFHKGKINSSYKLQLHSLLSMPSMQSVSSHDPWSMGNASFESHATTSSRDLPMTRASFHTAGTLNRRTCFILQVCHCDTIGSFAGCSCRLYRSQGASYVFFALVVHKERDQQVFTLLLFGYVDNKSKWLACSLSHMMFIVEYPCWTMDTHGRNKILIWSKKAVHGLMGTCCLQSTKQTLFINKSYNKEIAVAQGPWHGDRVG